MKLRRYKLSEWKGCSFLKCDTVKERVALNSVVVGLSSWMGRLPYGKENDGSIFCKVNSYHCGVHYKFPWMDAAKIQLSEFERVQMLEL